MWIIIFLAVILAAIAGLIYLISRVCKIGLIEKVSHGKKAFRIILSLILVIILIAILSLILGGVNAIICILHLVGFWLISDLILFIIQRVRKAAFKHYYAGLIAVIVSIAYLSAGWFMAHNVVRTDYSVTSDKKVGNIRIVQFADSHIGSTFDGEGLGKYVLEINKSKPDVVLITGDFVDDSSSKKDMIDACKELGKLKTSYGTYFAFGNHDKGYYGSKHRGYDGDDLISEMKKNGVKVLQDESVLIDNRFYIIGRQDYVEEQTGNKRAGMESLVKGLDKDKYFIVMDHQPHDYDNEAKANVDLVLSGHTHGGQLLPFTYVGEWIGVNDRTYGYEKRHNTNYIVTSGISDWAMDFKTGCRSEYVVINVKGR